MPSISLVIASIQSGTLPHQPPRLTPTLLELSREVLSAGWDLNCYDLALEFKDPSTINTENVHAFLSRCEGDILAVSVLSDYLPLVVAALRYAPLKRPVLLGGVGPTLVGYALSELLPKRTYLVLGSVTGAFVGLLQGVIRGRSTCRDVSVIDGAW